MCGESGAFGPLGQLVNALLPHKIAVDNMLKGLFYLLCNIFGTVVSPGDIQHSIF